MDGGYGTFWGVVGGVIILELGYISYQLKRRNDIQAERNKIYERFLERRRKIQINPSKLEKDIKEDR